MAAQSKASALISRTVKWQNWRNVVVATEAANFLDNVLRNMNIRTPLRNRADKRIVFLLDLKFNVFENLCGFF